MWEFEVERVWRVGWVCTRNLASVSATPTRACERSVTSHYISCCTLCRGQVILKESPEKGSRGGEKKKGTVLLCIFFSATKTKGKAELCKEGKRVGDWLTFFMIVRDDCLVLL